MFKLLRCLFIFCLLAVPSSVFAQDFVLSWSGPFGAGSATVSATNKGSGQFQVTSMSNGAQNGATITLVSPGVYGGNDNYIFPSYPDALVDNDGFSFTDGANEYDIFLPIQSIIDQTGAIPNTYYECTSAQSECVSCPAPTCASPMAYFTITPLTSAVATLDPAPGLFAPSTSTITTDPNVLSSAGNPVTAIAADGVAQVVIRLTVNDPGLQPYIVLTDEFANVAPANGEDGTLSNLSGGTSNSPTVVLPSIQTINGQYYAFVTYNSPVDYARATGQDASTASRQIAIEVTDGSGNILSSTQMNLLRPPVFFVHGLWGAPDTWDQFDLALQQDFPGLKTYRADFAKNNGKGVMLNTPDVLTQAYYKLNDFKVTKNAAAAQMDFIVHSMGGLISNTMYTFPLFGSPLSYGHGIIHKLITVDTPYYGSPLAAQTAASSPECKEKLKNLGAEVDGAIEDLIPSGPFLQQTFKIPTGYYYRHAIASYVSATQTDVADSAIDLLVSFVLTGEQTPIIGSELKKLQPVDICYPIFVTANTSPQDFSFTTYFTPSFDPYNGASDLVVSETSQLGPYSPGTTAHITSGLAHSHAVYSFPLFLNWSGTNYLTILPGSLDSGYGNPQPNTDIAYILLNASVNGTGVNSFAH